VQAEDFGQQLMAIRRAAGPGTVTELTASAIAYWNDVRNVNAKIDTDGTRALSGLFDMDARRWTHWKDWLSDWLTEPVLSGRHFPPAD
jgi:hypothetical protein